uniref:CW-type domain-containing protein n=1 Tax=Globisporangium ultimum (strain ATCC 200006 / CBS 805.95 / DAOM BR144) TaxID=431595 RepID=K3X686_GLOUD
MERPRAYDPTTDSGGYVDEREDALKIQTEFVDVYLLSPPEGEDRGIELRDFTIMKPKNNKMHRLVHFYPRCEISYTAAPPPPPPEEKLVTSPRGTTTILMTTSHRHNGGFSNPSRNAEVFRLKRKLLSEYFASVNAEFDGQGEGGYNRATMEQHDHGGNAPYSNNDHGYTHASKGQGYNSNYTYPRSASYRRPDSPTSSASSYSPLRPVRLPKYTRVEVGDEDFISMTSVRNPPMSLKARVQYIDSLWPGIAPIDDDEDIMDYYGLEVEIISEEEREKEQRDSAAAAQDTMTSSETAAAARTNVSPEKAPATNGAVPSPQKNDDGDGEVPEMTVETRSAALQKIKDAEKKVSPVASKQDDWVQCDKCQKWRRLPNHVNVSELPATWYCKMNRWDKRFNKCSVPEEKIAVLMKESDLVEYRERKFTLDFVQRLRRMEKALLQYKYTDARDDDGERKFVQCVQCLKKRPLLGGMDPSKIVQPFVCWMNWDELRASCSAPQGALPSRNPETAQGSWSGHGDDGAAGERNPKKGGASKATASSGKSNGDHHGSSSSKQDAVSSSSKKPSKSSNASSNSAKRKPTLQTTAASATEKSSSVSNGASSNAKKPKRR